MIESKEFRIEYTYPYLEAKGETDWTPAFDTLEKARDYMNSYNVTAGYGRTIQVQERTVVRSDWRESDE